MAQRTLTEAETDLTLGALDKAFQARIGKLFEVLGAATSADLKSRAAFEGFDAGLAKALAQRADCINLVTG
jgi:hypothetical protein